MAFMQKVITGNQINKINIKNIFALKNEKNNPKILMSTHNLYSLIINTKHTVTSTSPNPKSN